MSQRIALLEKASEQEPENPFIKFAICLEFKRLNDLTSALSRIKLLHRSHPDYLPLYYHFAQWLDESGAPDEADTIRMEGITLARKQGDLKTLSELQATLNDSHAED